MLNKEPIFNPENSYIFFRNLIEDTEKKALFWTKRDWANSDRRGNDYISSVGLWEFGINDITEAQTENKLFCFHAQHKNRPYSIGVSLMFNGEDLLINALIRAIKTQLRIEEIKVSKDVINAQHSFYEDNGCLFRNA